MAPPDCASQAEYIGYFADALTVLQTEAALERAARELGEDSAAENIDYLEVRWAPLLHLTAGLHIVRVVIEHGSLDGHDAGNLDWFTFTGRPTPRARHSKPPTTTAARRAAKAGAIPAAR